MVRFINEKAGTQRNPDGTLFPTAGRVTELDDIVSAAAAIDATTVAAIKTAGESLTDAAKASSKTYVAVAEKIIAKGASYVDTEIKRLEGILSKSSVTADKKTDFQLKQNILKAFAK
jgi:protein disulfide-isomerase A6